MSLITNAYHNCYLAYNYCPIWLEGTQLPTNCSVFISDPFKNRHELTGVDCTSDLIMANIDDNTHAKLMHQIFRSYEYSKENTTKIFVPKDYTFEIEDDDTGNVVASTEIAFDEPAPSITNTYTNCQIAEGDFYCPIWLEGFGYVRHQHIEGSLYVNDNQEPYEFKTRLIKRKKYQMYHTKYSALVEIQLSKEAKKIIYNNCEVTMDFLAKNSDDKYLDAYTPPLVIRNEEVCNHN
eukprot:Awhi_evm2s13981